MPNQLSTSKKRKTVAEHAAVLAVLEQIAKAEGVTSTDLIRKAVRDMVSQQVSNPDTAESLRRAFLAHAPIPPKRFKTPAQVASYKRSLREYDSIALEMGLQHATEVQERNSIHQTQGRPILTGHI